jgi:hypothetical protein
MTSSPTDVIDFLRAELAGCGHPAIVDVQDLGAPGVAVTCGDGVKIFTKVVAVAPSGRLPQQPTWPGRADLKGARR